MDFLEKDLEEIIYSGNRDSLEERGLPIEGKLYRQIRIGNYGVADIISVKKRYKEAPMVDHGRWSPYLDITIFELKQNKVGISTFLQAIRYARGIQRYIEKRKPYLNYNIRIYLIGKYIDHSDFIYLPNVLPLAIEYGVFLTVLTYKYTEEGIIFEDQDGYYLTEEGF